MKLMNGYEMTTTWISDFSIANIFGEKAIRDTCKTAKKLYKDDVVFMAELDVALNLHLWQAYNNGNDKLAKLYDELWREHHDEMLTEGRWNDDEFRTYFMITD